MENRTEFVKFLDRLAHEPSALEELSPRQFEIMTAYLMESQGYEVTLGSLRRDVGADFVAVLNSPLASITAIVECKLYSSDRRVGIDVVENLYWHIESLKANSVILVTNSHFTMSAIQFAKKHGQLQLVDRGTLMRLAKLAGEKYNERAQSIAYALTHLTVSTVDQIEGVRLNDPENLILPDRFASSIASVDGIPLALLKAVCGDPRTMRALTPRQFEEFIAELIERIGFSDVVLTPRSGDGGKDVVASKIIHGIPLTFYFECKKYAEDNKVQLDRLRALLGVVAHDAHKVNKGILVTTSTFTAGAQKLILSEGRLGGKDYAGITDWISEYTKRHQ
jgi:HJR/Mrr/RecB family endonuclease